VRPQHVGRKQPDLLPRRAGQLPDHPDHQQKLGVGPELGRQLFLREEDPQVKTGNDDEQQGGDVEALQAANSSVNHHRDQSEAGGDHSQELGNYAEFGDNDCALRGQGEDEQPESDIGDSGHPAFSIRRR
jgi:hypothetical protein